MPRSQEWQPIIARPSRPGHLPLPGAPTVPRMGKPRPSGERRIRSFRGIGTGAEARASHTSTCVFKHIHTGPFVCPHPPPAQAHPGRRADAPAPLPRAHPPPLQSHALDHETHASNTPVERMLRGPRNFYKVWAQGPLCGRGLSQVDLL